MMFSIIFHHFLGYTDIVQKVPRVEGFKNGLHQLHLHGPLRQECHWGG